MRRVRLVMVGIGIGAVALWLASSHSTTPRSRTDSDARTVAPIARAPVRAGVANTPRTARQQIGEATTPPDSDEPGELPATVDSVLADLQAASTTDIEGAIAAVSGDSQSYWDLSDERRQIYDTLMREKATRLGLPAVEKRNGLPDVSAKLAEEKQRREGTP